MTTLPTGIGGRPFTPAPGMPTPELRIARFRRHAGRLLLPALILIAVCALTGFFLGNLPSPLEDWMLLTAAAVVILLLVLLPFASWWGHVYTLTTRRVIERRGVFAVRRREYSHTRGYSIRVRRGPLQRLAGTGTLTLTNEVDEPLRLRGVPLPALVHEVLVDQVEVNQILAHRDAQPLPEQSA